MSKAVPVSGASAVALLGILLCAASMASHGQGQAGQSSRQRAVPPDPLASLVPPPWTGKIEVSAKSDPVHPPKSYKSDYVVSWSTATKGGSFTETTDEHGTFKAIVRITAAPAGSGSEVDRSGDVTATYRYLRTRTEHQNIVCRGKGRNPWKGELTRIETEERHVVGTGQVARIQLIAPDEVSASIAWNGTMWRIRVFIKPKKVDTAVATTIETSACGKPETKVNDRTSYVLSDHVELDAATGIRDKSAQKLAGTVVVPVSKKDYSVSWNLTR